MFKMKYVMLMFGAILLFTNQSASAAKKKGNKILFTRGTVYVKKSVTSVTWKVARVGRAIQENEVIKTARESAAIIQLVDGSRIKLGPKTILLIKSIGRHNNDFEIGKGSLVAQVKKLQKGRFRIATPTGVAGVRGTLFFVGVTGIGQNVRSIFAVKKGEIAVHAYKDATTNKKIAPGHISEIKFKDSIPGNAKKINRIDRIDWGMSINDDTYSPIRATDFDDN